MTYRQNIGCDCVVNREYQVNGGIADLLDRFDADDLFLDTKGTSEYSIETPNESRAYRITIEFKKGPQRIVTGSFDKNGLPNDWPEFAEEILAFISFYEQGELVNSVIYDKIKRRNEDFIFCSVTF